MADPGTPIAIQVALPHPRQEVFSRLMMATSSNSGGTFDSTAVATDGSSFINIERKYLPTWALVVAIIGFFCFLLGLLALIARDSERCTITLQDLPGGTHVLVSGAATPTLQNTIAAAINSMQR